MRFLLGLYIFLSIRYILYEIIIYCTLEDTLLLNAKTKIDVCYTHGFGNINFIIFVLMVSEQECLCIYSLYIHLFDIPVYILKGCVTKGLLMILIFLYLYLQHYIYAYSLICLMFNYIVYITFYI